MAEFVILYMVFAVAVVSGNDVYKMEIRKGNFAWKQCNQSVVPVAFRSLSLSPDPIKYGDNLIVDAELDVTEEIGSKGLEVDISAKIIEGTQEYEMCDQKPEWCHFANICQNISKIPCPKVMEKLKLPCRCPFKPSTYNVPKIPIPIPPSSFQIQGTFNVTVNLSENKKAVGCFSVVFCLGSCSNTDY